MLDVIEGDDLKYHPTFGVTLDAVLGAESQEMQKYTEPWDKLPVESITPDACFRSKEECWEYREAFGILL